MSSLTLDRVIPSYPEAAPARDRWILERRPERTRRDPRRVSAAFIEDEALESGGRASYATLFLTNRECPWRCLMCDLWKNTLDESVSPGAIPEQIREALRGLPPARRVKLYNSGSFFDRRAIPREDHRAIADLVAPFERVVVESHPALVGDDVWRFRDALHGTGSLEVAMGLETVHPDVLPRLNKRMTLDSYREAAGALATRGVALRVFVLAGLPWVGAADASDWTLHSVKFAFDCVASSVSIIPTRTGNGAMEALARGGMFEPPSLDLLERCLEDGLREKRGLVFADLWDLAALSRCGQCFDARRGRLAAMNLSQSISPAIVCPSCGTS